MVRKKGWFPTFWIIVLILALIWFANDIGWLSENFNLPWLPAIIIIIALGAIINHLTG